MDDWMLQQLVHKKTATTELSNYVAKQVIRRVGYA